MNRQVGLLATPVRAFALVLTLTLSMTTGEAAPNDTAQALILQAKQNEVAEWRGQSSRVCADPSVPSS